MSFNTYRSLFDGTIPGPLVPDGKFLYTTGTNAASIYQYGLSTLYDITTAEEVNKIASQDSSPENIQFSKDGTKLYEVGYSGTPSIYQSGLSTAFDISTASFETSIDAQDLEPTGIMWNNDGTKLYEVGVDVDAKLIYQYDVSTAFDIATASFSDSVGHESGTIVDIAWNDDGSLFYELDESFDDIFQLTASTPFDITTLSLDSTIDSLLPDTPKAIEFSTDGSQMFISRKDPNTTAPLVAEYNLSTPFDVTSASLGDTNSSLETQLDGIAFNSYPQY